MCTKNTDIFSYLMLKQTYISLIVGTLTDSLQLPVCFRKKMFVCCVYWWRVQFPGCFWDNTSSFKMNLFSQEKKMYVPYYYVACMKYTRQDVPISLISHAWLFLSCLVSSSPIIFFIWITVLILLSLNKWHVRGYVGTSWKVMSKIAN